MMNLIKKKTEKGFTLIELMIVVAIIGILAAIAIPQFAEYRVKAFNSAAEADLRNIMTGQEAEFADTQAYSTEAAGSGPTALTNLTAVRISNNVGYKVTAANSNRDYSAYTGHQSGDKVFGGDSNGYIGADTGQATPDTTAQGLTAFPVNSGTYSAI
jgi:prepilin-type N-terminal cleavage/methylation domain-containing protein